MRSGETSGELGVEMWRYGLCRVRHQVLKVSTLTLAAFSLLFESSKGRLFLEEQVADIHSSVS